MSLLTTLPWPPPVTTVQHKLISNGGYFQSALTGETQTAARDGARFAFAVKMQSLDDLRRRQWSAFLSQAQDEGATFLWGFYPLGRPYAYPSGSGWGTPLVNGGSQTGRSLVTDGWTVGATLKQGDAIAFDNGVFREIHLLTADVTANGSGQATLPLVPSIHISPSDNASLLLDGHASNYNVRCACDVMVADNEQAAWDLSGFSANFDFMLVETLRR